MPRFAPLDLPKNLPLPSATLVGRLVAIAECFSWYAVLTTNHVGSAVENSIWAVAFFAVGIGLCRVQPDFDGLDRIALAIAVVGIAGYLTFLVTVDVPGEQILATEASS
jgi:hypothetical protein